MSFCLVLNTVSVPGLTLKILAVASATTPNDGSIYGSIKNTPPLVIEYTSTSDELLKDGIFWFISNDAIIPVLTSLSVMVLKYVVSEAIIAIWSPTSNSSIETSDENTTCLTHTTACLVGYLLQLISLLVKKKSLIS